MQTRTPVKSPIDCTDSWSPFCQTLGLVRDCVGWPNVRVSLMLHKAATIGGATVEGM